MSAPRSCKDEHHQIVPRRQAPRTATPSSSIPAAPRPPSWPTTICKYDGRGHRDRRRMLRWMIDERLTTPRTWTRRPTGSWSFAAPSTCTRPPRWVAAPGFPTSSSPPRVGSRPQRRHRDRRYQTNIACANGTLVRVPRRHAQRPARQLLARRRRRVTRRRSAPTPASRRRFRRSRRSASYAVPPEELADAICGPPGHGRQRDAATRRGPYPLVRRHGWNPLVRRRPTESPRQHSIARPPRADQPVDIDDPKEAHYMITPTLQFECGDRNTSTSSPQRSPCGDT